MNFIQDQRLKIWMQHPEAIRRLPFGIHLKNKHPIATIKTKKKRTGNSVDLYHTIGEVSE